MLGGSPGRTAEPPRFDLVDHGAYVGRAPEIRRLRDRLDASLAGRGQVVLVAGEAGIGKTRTAEEIAGIARAGGARVLVGRCYEDEGAPAYWPWVQVVRACAEAADGPAGATEAERAAVVTLRGVAEGVAPGAADAGATARFRLFDGIAALFKRLARDAGLVLLVDDLHGADRASLLLLEFLAREVADHRILIVGTYRDGETAEGRPLAQTLSELARHSHYQRIALAGMGAEDVGRLIEQVTGARPAGAVVARIHAATDGNPLFVGEVVRLLATHGGLDAWPADALVVPEGVRAVIGGRLGRLSGDCQDVLTTAAVVGRTFALALLERLTGLGRGRLVDLLGEAVRARVITPSAGPLRYAFAHGLLRETLCTALDPSRRVDLHRRIGEALEAAGDPAQLSEVAYHYYEAAPGSDGGKALEYAVRAAERAAGVLAWEDAVAQYGRALELLDAGAAPDPSRRCELLLALGAAETRAGDWQKGRRTFGQAAEIARRRGAAEQLARAALGSATWLSLSVSPSLVGLLEEALATVGDADGKLRALLLGHLARALYFGDAVARRTALGGEAVAIARRLGDPGTLAEVLNLRRLALWGPDSVEERLAASSEIVELAERTASHELAFAGYAYRVADRFELGDVRGAEMDVAAAARLLEELRRPPSLAWFLDVWRIAKALFDGRFPEAERLLQEAFPRAGQTGDESASMCLGFQLVALRRESGLEGMDAAIAAVLAEHPEMDAVRAQLAWVHAELGAAAEASRHFAALAATDFASLRRDFGWLAAMVMLADVCAFLGDARHAASLYEQLLPFARRNATLAVGVYCWGAVAHHLGRLAVTMGRLDAAARHFEDALELNARMATAPNLARTAYAYATVLLDRGGAEHRTRAAELLAYARDTAERLGMKTLAARIGALPAAARRPAAAADVPTGRVAARRPAGPAGAVFRSEGDYWLVAYEGSASRLKDGLGLRYLACLLAHPGREFLASDLVALVRPRADPEAHDGGTLQDASGDSGELLDGKAKADYGRRLRDLKHALESAEACGDVERTRQIEAEMSFVAQELARGLGLGGRERRAGSRLERARVSVTTRLRTTLAKIAAGNPALGTHLAASVRTGAYCTYAPDPRTAPAWTFDSKEDTHHAV